jgi:hypothetical protein
VSRGREGRVPHGAAELRRASLVLFTTVAAGAVLQRVVPAGPRAFVWATSGGAVVLVTLLALVALGVAPSGRLRRRAVHVPRHGAPPNGASERSRLPRSMSMSMSMTRIAIGLPALVLLLVPLGAVAGDAAADAGRDVARLVDKTLTAYGGTRALRHVVAVRQRGRVTSTMRSGAVGTMTRVFARPARLRVEVQFPAEPLELRLLDGDIAYRGDVATGGALHKALLLQATRLDLPWTLAEHRAELRDAGTVERDGRTLRALEIPLGEGLTITVEIDPATGHILRSTGTTEGEAPLEFSTRYDDFRMVGGLLFAFAEVNFAMGHQTGESHLDRVELLRTASRDLFRPAPPLPAVDSQVNGPHVSRE